MHLVVSTLSLPGPTRAVVLADLRRALESGEIVIQVHTPAGWRPALEEPDEVLYDSDIHRSLRAAGWHTKTAERLGLEGELSADTGILQLIRNFLSERLRAELVE